MANLPIQKSTNLSSHLDICSSCAELYPELVSLEQGKPAQCSLKIYSIEEMRRIVKKVTNDFTSYLFTGHLDDCSNCRHLFADYMAEEIEKKRAREKSQHCSLGLATAEEISAYEQKEEDYADHLENCKSCGELYPEVGAIFQKSPLGKTLKQVSDNLELTRELCPSIEELKVEVIEEAHLRLHLLHCLPCQGEREAILNGENIERTDDPPLPEGTLPSVEHFVEMLVRKEKLEKLGITPDDLSKGLDHLENELRDKFGLDLSAETNDERQVSGQEPDDLEALQ